MPQTKRADLKVVPPVISDELPVPNNPEAEEAVIGSLLLDREVIVKLAGLLEPGDFFSEVRAAIFQTILEMYIDPNSTTRQPRPGDDLILVRDELKKRNLLGDGEGQVTPSYLINLLRNTPTPYNVLHYTRIVRAYSLRRRLLSLSGQVAAMAMDLELEAENAVAAAGAKLQELAALAAQQNPDYFLSHEESLNYIERFNELAPNPWQSDGKNARRLCFGWDELDGRDWANPPLMSLLPSTLTTILGRTGGGKTLAAMQIADANAKRGAFVLYFHVELNQEQMLARRYCRLTGVPVLAQLRREINEREQQLLVRASGEISSWPGRVDFVHCPNWDADRLVQEIKARHHAVLARYGRGYDLVILDYLQRLGRAEKLRFAPEHEALAYSVRAYSDAANELNFAALMTSQVGRSEARQFEPPDVSEGLGTGDIERCSNQLLALAVSEDRATVRYAVRKNTFGENGTSGTLIYDARHLQFL